MPLHWLIVRIIGKMTIAHTKSEAKPRFIACNGLSTFLEDLLTGFPEGRFAEELFHLPITFPNCLTLEAACVHDTPGSETSTYREG
jgi:hypothetical protein